MKPQRYLRHSGFTPTFIFTVFAVAATTNSTQANDNALLEEVVVTAQKREQSLDDIGIAIDAFTGQQLRESGANSLLDISQLSPGLNIRGPFGDFGYPIITLRGVNTDGFIETLPQSTAVYADGVYLSQPPMLGFRMLDLERVEVLKGPQGTLYGRNTIAGAVNFVANRPTFEREGYVNAGYGRYNRFTLETAHGGALSETVAGRIAVKYLRQTDSPLTNLNPDVGDGGELDQVSGRLSLLFEPSDEVELLVQVYAGRDESDVWPFALIPGGEDTDGDGIPDRLCNEFFTGNVSAAQRNCLAGDPFGSGDTFNDTDGDPYTINQNAIGRHNNESVGAMVELNWDLGDMGFTSVTGWDDFSRRDELDEDAGPTTAIDNVRSSDIKQFSQELRLSSGDAAAMTWLAGLYFSDDELTGDPSFDSGGRRDTSTLETRTYGLYGQVEYPLSDDLTLIAGGRYTQVERDFSYRTNGFFAAPALQAGITDDFSDGDWSGKIGLDWRVSEDTLVYASVSRGFNAGTYNSQFIDAVIDIDPTSSETIVAYETGIKTKFANGRASLEASTYFYDYQDIQVVAVVPRGTIDANVLTNADGADLYGFETQLRLLPTDWLDINLGISYINSELGELSSPAPGTGLDSPAPFNGDPFAGGQIVDLEGESLPNAPEWSFNSSFTVTLPVNGQYDFVARADISWEDEIKRDLIGTRALYTEDHWNVDASFSVQTADDKWRFSVWGKNLADETWITEAYQVLGFGFYIAGANYNYPRTFGLSVDYGY
ncbi:TonB-dependent receptor [Exilibacterium tricleocarpae]|nr:TonB-dependent receptor [Exilibacterium tricleocarpae]